MASHIGRSWNGPGHLEALCPCPKAECKQHPPENMKTIRTSHRPEDCPEIGRDVVVAMGRTIKAREAVVKAADEWDGVYFSFELDDALDDYRAAVEHEAAERIRNSERLRDFTDDHMGDCNAAADAIDPDVEEST